MHYSVIHFQGGIKSVVWTDTFQTVIMFIGLITILVKVRACLSLVFSKEKISVRVESLTELLL